MTRWPLLLPPPAVSTSPSRSRRSSSSIVVKSPLRRSSPLSCRRAIHRRRAAPSITIHSESRCPSPPIAVVLSVHRRRACTVSYRPSPSRSHRAVPRRRGAVVPSIAVEEPSRCTLPSRINRPCRLTTLAPHLAPPSSKPLVRLVDTLPLLTPPPPPICLRPAPLIAAITFLCLSSVLLVVPSPRFSHRHLPSAGASASHCAAASCHAHLGHLVRLVKASPFLMPPPPICGIIESRQRSSLMLV